MHKLPQDPKLCSEKELFKAHHVSNSTYLITCYQIREQAKSTYLIKCYQIREQAFNYLLRGILK